MIDLFKRKKPKLKKSLKPKATKPEVIKKEAKPKKEKKASKAYKVLIKPMITEKATDLTGFRKYVFKVAQKATKSAIKQAVEDFYKVKVKKIHTINVLGKKRRYGKTLGKTSSWKKAIVTLKPGEKIEIMEGV